MTYPIYRVNPETGRPEMKPLPMILTAAKLVCRSCGESFDSFRRSTKYCSGRCRSVAFRQTHNLNVKVRECIQCGNDFIAVRSDQRYCRTACRVKACRSKSVNQKSGSQKKQDN